MKVSPRRVYPEFRCDALRWYLEKFSHSLLAYFCRLPFNVLPYCLPYKVHPRQIEPLVLIDLLYQFV